MSDSSLFRANIAKQFVVLTHRAFRTQWRDVKYNMARFITFGLQSIFFGVVFRDIHRTDFASVQVRMGFGIFDFRVGLSAMIVCDGWWPQSTLGVICLMQGFPTAMSILTSSSVMLNVRAPFYRETASNTYKSALFPLASFIPEIFWLAVMMLAVGG
jgi:ABC-2 type transporter